MRGEPQIRSILRYATASGRCPFDEWFESVKDQKIRAIVATRLNRLAQGNFGLCKRLDGRLWELKIDYGPGLRVYFAEDGNAIVVLLCGGDKSTQKRDIQKARMYWKDYRE